MWNPFKRQEKPSPPALNDDLYNSLFADNPNLFVPLKEHRAISWIYANITPTINELETISEDQTIESRLKFLALNTALNRGTRIQKKIYFGTIMEVPVNGKYDVLAYYSDRRARYYNHSGKGVVYEGGRDAVDAAIDRAIAASVQICNLIGPWEKPRLPKPAGDLWRFSFLLSDGLYFGQGPMKALESDQMASAMLSSGAEVMQSLINATQ